MSFYEEDIPPGKPPRMLNEVLGKLLRRMHVSDETSAIGLFSGWRQIVGMQLPIMLFQRDSKNEF